MSSLLPPEDRILTICIAQGWETFRKCATETLTFEAHQRHIDIQHAEATQLMFDVLSEPAVSHQIPDHVLTTYLITHSPSFALEVI